MKDNKHYGFVSRTRSKRTGYDYFYFYPSKSMASLGMKKTRLATENHASEIKQIVANFYKGAFMNKPKFAKHLSVIFRKCRARASERGIEFSISLQDVLDKLDECKGLCSVSGVPLVLDGKTTGYRSPFRPSIDRIDATKGYIAGNIRIVCVAVNAALSDWGDDVFWTVVLYAATRRGLRTYTRTLDEQIVQLPG